MYSVHVIDWHYYEQQGDLLVHVHIHAHVHVHLHVQIGTTMNSKVHVHVHNKLDHVPILNMNCIHVYSDKTPPQKMKQHLTNKALVNFSSTS